LDPIIFLLEDGIPSMGILVLFNHPVLTDLSLLNWTGVLSTWCEPGMEILMQNGEILTSLMKLPLMESRLETCSAEPKCSGSGVDVHLPDGRSAELAAGVINHWENPIWISGEPTRSKQ
jgi:hypothetical protein